MKNIYRNRVCYVWQIKQHLILLTTRLAESEHFLNKDTAILIRDLLPNISSKTLFSFRQKELFN